MKEDNLHIGIHARDKLIRGVKMVAGAVGGTMGTGGTNSLIEAIENPGHYVTNDGFSIANAVRFKDPIEEMGRKILVESINRANTQSGDGSSTTAVLTAAILDEGMRHMDTESAMDVKRSLEECIPILEENIRNEQAREITPEEVGKVAAISAEDEAIGAMIQEIYIKIGKSGIIQWDISKTPEDSYTIGNGLTIEGAGFVSPYMGDIDEQTGGLLNRAKWKDVTVLLTKDKITTAQVFDETFKALNDKNIKEVVVFCNEYEPTVIPQLIQTRVVKGFKTLLVRMPTFWKDQWYEDLALATGATVIDPSAGLSFKDMKLSHFGKLGHITVTKDQTFIDGIQDLSSHIEKLNAEATEESVLRASRLNTKTARYFVGAHSDSALAYRRLKVEDAIAAAWQALNGGIVAGGGTALVMASDSLPVTIGGTILREALKAPAIQIAKNVGLRDIVIGSDYRCNRGLDTKTKGFKDMFEAGITDPANITINAIRNAISVASAILTCNVIVTYPRQNEPEQQYPVMR